MTPEITVRARMHSLKGSVLDRSVKLTLNDTGVVVAAEDMVREDALPFSFIRALASLEGAKFDDREFWEDWVVNGGQFDRMPTKKDRDNLRDSAQLLLQKFLRFSIEGQFNPHMDPIAQGEFARYEYTQIVSGTRIKLWLEYKNAGGEIMEHTIGEAEVTQIQGIRLIKTPAFALVY